MRESDLALRTCHPQNRSRGKGIVRHRPSKQKVRISTGGLMGTKKQKGSRYCLNSSTKLLSWPFETNGFILTLLTVFEAGTPRWTVAWTSIWIIERNAVRVNHIRCACDVMVFGFSCLTLASRNLSLRRVSKLSKKHQIKTHFVKMLLMLHNAWLN